MGNLGNFRNTFRTTVNIADHIDTEAAERSIRSNIYFKGPNAWILAIAIIIASVGLNVNSIPVIIGAMLISPLMGPIFGIGLGLGVNDMPLVKVSAKNLLVMMVISLVASFIYFLITPLSLSNPTELLSRTNPTIYDVLIALFGGFAGILEQCRKDKGTVFSGVAIATALMPPLCTAGFGLANGNLSYFFGALYLFIINCLFIMLATYISVRYFKFSRKEFEDKAKERRAETITTVLIVIFIIPSIWSAVTLITQNNFDANATAFVERNKAYDKSIIYDYKISHNDGSSIELFFTGEPLTEKTKENIFRMAREFNIKPEQVLINDHTTTEDLKDIELVKDIYDKMDYEIGRRDEEIRRLREELRATKGNDIPYVQITKEVRNSYPSVIELNIAQGATVSADSLSMKANFTVVATCDSTGISTEDSARLKEWLKIRLDTERLELIVF